jgi:hypothetical protein
MRDELSRFMVVRYKEDELDLPAKTEQTLYVDLSPKQRRAYDQLVSECLARLDDGTVVKAAEGLTLLTRLRQVATGLDLLGHDVSDSSKLDMALELIEDNPDEAFVVFSWFKAQPEEPQRLHQAVPGWRGQGVHRDALDARGECELAAGQSRNLPRPKLQSWGQHAGAGPDLSHRSAAARDGDPRDREINGG